MRTSETRELIESIYPVFIQAIENHPDPRPSTIMPLVAQRLYGNSSQQIYVREAYWELISQGRIFTSSSGKITVMSSLDYQANHHVTKINSHASIELYSLLYSIIVPSSRKLSLDDIVVSVEILLNHRDSLSGQEIDYDAIVSQALFYLDRDGYVELDDNLVVTVLKPLDTNVHGYQNTRDNVVV